MRCVAHASLVHSYITAQFKDLAQGEEIVVYRLDHQAGIRTLKTRGNIPVELSIVVDIQSEVVVESIATVQTEENIHLWQSMRLSAVSPYLPRNHFVLADQQFLSCLRIGYCKGQTVAKYR